MKNHPNIVLRARRAILNTIQGREASACPRYLSHLDQQEKYPGDRGLEHMEQVNSPYHRWKIGQVFFQQKPRAGIPPIGVLIDQTRYWARCRLPHPEWAWSLRNTDRGRVIVAIARRTASLLTGWLLEVPSWPEAMKDGVRYLWERGIGRQRYPKTLRITLRKIDWDRALAAAQTKRTVSQPMLRTWLKHQTLMNALNRTLCLNTDWLETKWSDAPDESSYCTRAGFTIRVRRTKRVLGHYVVPAYAFVGWSNGPDRTKGPVHMTNEYPAPSTTGADEIPEGHGTRIGRTTPLWKSEVQRNGNDTGMGPLYIEADKPEDAARKALEMHGVSDTRQVEREGWGVLVTSAADSAGKPIHGA